MNASRQVIRPQEASNAPGDADHAGLAREVASRLAELEAALQRTPPDAAAIRLHVAELRALTAKQVDAREELSSLADFLQTRNEREKAALSRELHDQLGGILTPAKMDVAWLEERLADDPQYGARVRRLSALIDQGIDLKRRIIENLRPSLLDHLGIASALQWYVDETCRQNELDPDVRIAEDVGRFTPDLEIAIYRLVQDCLANTVKHARAKRFELTLQRTGEGLHLDIADDGVGIDDVRKAQGVSHGLANMAHRVRSLRGRFDLQSQPGEGTRVTIFIPTN